MTPAKLTKWLRVAERLGAEMSTCSRRQYGAIVLSADGRVAGMGFNGTAPGTTHCVDGGCPRGRGICRECLCTAGQCADHGQPIAHGSSYEGNCPAIHAEANALLYSDRSMRQGGTLIVNGPPCWGCSTLIAGSGVARVVHREDPAYEAWPKCRALLEAAGVEVVGLA